MASALTSSQKSISLKRILSLISLSLVLLAVPRIVRAQPGSSAHTVRVTVATINNLAVSSGTVSMTISSANVTVGQDLMGPVIDAATNLQWGINSSSKKVTVATNLAAPKFTLKVLALTPSPGTATEVTLSTIATDFLIGLGKSSGTTPLQYTGTALASSGSGTDTHLVTYTITTQ